MEVCESNLPESLIAFWQQELRVTGEAGIALTAQLVRIHVLLIPSGRSSAENCYPGVYFFVMSSSLSLDVPQDNIRTVHDITQGCLVCTRCSDLMHC